jgi:hypothetical protein
MNKTNLRLIRPLTTIIVFTGAVCVFAKNWLARNGIDYQVLLAGNLLLYFVSLAAFLISSRALNASNPQAFVRAMYGSFIVKFFVVVIAAFIYIMLAKKNVSKPTLGIWAVLYIIYTVIETKALTRLLKQKKHA